MIGENMLFKKVLNSGNEFSLEMFEIQAKHYALDRHFQDQLPPPSDWEDLIIKAINELQCRQGDSLTCRLGHGDLKSEWNHLMLKLRFAKKHERIEFKLLIKDLPIEEMSPLIWKSWELLPDWDLKKLSEFMKNVAKDDPDYDPNEDAEACLKGFLATKGLTADKDCCHIGFYQGRPSALVIAQVAVADGWSRITYMGVTPEFRGLGFGKWVHRHGFTMMREQGGKLYHGGTVATNLKMIELFRSHGCVEFRRMDEWVYRIFNAENFGSNPE